MMRWNVMNLRTVVFGWHGHVLMPVSSSAEDHGHEYMPMPPTGKHRIPTGMCDHNAHAETVADRRCRDMLGTP